MTTLAAWVAFSAILVLAFRQRPAVWVSAGILTAVLVPTVVTRAWLADAGNLGRIHPAAWIFVLGLAVTTVFSPARRGVPRWRSLVALAVIGWVALAGVIIVRHTGLGSLGAFVVYYLTPPLAFLAIHAALTREDPRLFRKVVPVVLAAGVVESVLALLQLLTHSAVVFERYFATNYWWDDYLQRSLGTFDSPLDLAAFLTMLIPFAATVRSTPRALVLAALFATAVVVSGSRTGVVVAAVVVVVIVFVRSSNAIPAILTSIALVLAAAVLLASPLGTTLLGRFGFDGQLSTQARADALAAGLRLAADDLVGGRGSGFAYSYSRTFLESSFEDAYLATAIDLGLLVAVALVVIQLCATFSGRGSRLLFRVPGLLAVLWGFSYSSFVSTSTFGILSWTFVALSGAVAYRGIAPTGRPRRRAVTSDAYVAVRPASPRTLVGKA